jgi:predicted XRE-type DNA-binding protein
MNGLGQNFDDFMVEQGLYDEAKELSAKKLIVLELKQEMEAQKLSKGKVAEKMHTSRAAVDNILNPDYNTSIGTPERFASVLGKSIHISVQ